jgi:hypothetical protein
VAKKRKSKSRRPRQVERSKRPKKFEQATRPAGRQAYPSPAERERIIKRRDELLEQLISTLIMTVEGKPDQSLINLVREYGPDEVTFVLNKFRETTTTRELIGEEAFLYRQYRQAFARFGGDRPFLNKADYEKQIFEHGMLVGRRKFKSLVPFLARRSKRERELYDLLLVGVDYWEDITPLSVPPRPADFDSPPAGAYDYPTRTLLEWGWEDNEERLLANAKNTAKWHPAISDLAQMVFDEGLLEGWPGEAASWASFHALHMLGQLKADDHAGHLLALLGRENDWLSDRLPVVWGQMGPSAESPLWAYLADRRHTPEKRSLALRGLSRIAEGHPQCQLEIVNRMANLLQHAPAEDATVNGYIVHVLHRMRAVEAREAISDAFEQDKVDPKIIQPYDVDFLHDW